MIASEKRHPGRGGKVCDAAVDVKRMVREGLWKEVALDLREVKVQDVWGSLACDTPKRESLGCFGRIPGWRTLSEKWSKRAVKQITRNSKYRGRIWGLIFCVKRGLWRVSRKGDAIWSLRRRLLGAEPVMGKLGRGWPDSPWVHHAFQSPSPPPEESEACGPFLSH